MKIKVFSLVVLPNGEINIIWVSQALKVGDRQMLEVATILATSSIWHPEEMQSSSMQMNTIS